MEAGIDQYFRDCEENSRPITMEGLAYSLNIDVRTLSNYGRDDNYFPSISRARQRCLVYKAERLYDKDGVQGAKFDLTNNSERMGGLRYADRQEYAVSAEVQPDSESIREQLKDLLGGLSEDERKALSDPV